jgi:hypothetical protein
VARLIKHLSGGEVAVGVDWLTFQSDREAIDCRLETVCPKLGLRQHNPHIIRLQPTFQSNRKQWNSCPVFAPLGQKFAPIGVGKKMPRLRGNQFSLSSARPW